MKLFFALLFTSAAVSAQDENPRPATTPQQIAAHLNDHHDVHWGALLSRFHIPAQDLPLNCGNLDRDPCAAEVIQVPGRQQVLLRIEDTQWQETYWRFFFEGSKWRYGGAFTPFVKYFKPRHQIISFGGKPFLLLNGQSEAGTGLSSEYQAWFDLTLPKFEEVFGFTVDGHQSMLGFGVSQTIKAHVRSLETGPPERIRVSRTATFMFEGVDTNPIPLGSRTAETVYTRRPDGEFKFDSAASESTEKEVEGMYDSFLELSNEQFLRFDFAALRQIAEGRDRRQKQALARFLAECKNTPEKQKLLRSLTNRASEP